MQDINNNDPISNRFSKLDKDIKKWKLISTFATIRKSGKFATLQLISIDIEKAIYLYKHQKITLWVKITHIGTI